MSIFKLSQKSKKFLDSFRILLERDIQLRQAQRLSKEGKTSFYQHRVAQDKASAC